MDGTRRHSREGLFVRSICFWLCQVFANKHLGEEGCKAHALDGQHLELAVEPQRNSGLKSQVVVPLSLQKLWSPSIWAKCGLEVGCHFMGWFARIKSCKEKTPVVSPLRKRSCSTSTQVYSRGWVNASLFESIVSLEVFPQSFDH